MWPFARYLIVKNIFLPYIALILYYTLYLTVMKKLLAHHHTDDESAAEGATSSSSGDALSAVDTLLKLILFFGCAYFFQQDLLQIKTTTNPIVLWSYQNLIPLSTIIFILIYDTFIKPNDEYMKTTFFSISSFLIWSRVLHLLKIFESTSYLLRLAAQIMFRMRYLIFIILISLAAFGYTFYFLNTDPHYTPVEGFKFMFNVLLGFYDPNDFNTTFLSILYIMVIFVNTFFIMTLIIALSVIALEGDNDVDGNQSYQDKASLICLYSYLLQDKPIRRSYQNYLLLATVTERQQRASKKGGKGGIIGGSSAGGSENKKIQQKMLKTMEDKMAALQ